MSIYLFPSYLLGPIALYIIRPTASIYETISIHPAFQNMFGLTESDISKERNRV